MGTVKIGRIINLGATIAAFMIVLLSVPVRAQQTFTDDDLKGYKAPPITSDAPKVDIPKESWKDREIREQKEREQANADEKERKRQERLENEERWRRERAVRAEEDKARALQELNRKTPYPGR